MRIVRRQEYYTKRVKEKFAPKKKFEEDSDSPNPPSPTTANNLPDSPGNKSRGGSPRSPSPDSPTTIKLDKPKRKKKKAPSIIVHDDKWNNLFHLQKDANNTEQKKKFVKMSDRTILPPDSVTLGFGGLRSKSTIH